MSSSNRFHQPHKQVEISRNYTKVEWHEDLKRFCKRAGAEDKPTVFLFSDSQIKSEGFVEDINNLLNSGEVREVYYVTNIVLHEKIQLYNI